MILMPPFNAYLYTKMMKRNMKRNEEDNKMTEKEKLSKLIKTAARVEITTVTPNNKDDDAIKETLLNTGEIADFLLKSGVVIIDEKTALAMNAGAYAIEHSDHLMMSDYVFNPFEKSKEISYRQAAEILRELAKDLKEN